MEVADTKTEEMENSEATGICTEVKNVPIKDNATDNVESKMESTANVSDGQRGNNCEKEIDTQKTSDKVMEEAPQDDMVNKSIQKTMPLYVYQIDNISTCSRADTNSVSEQSASNSLQVDSIRIGSESVDEDGNGIDATQEEYEIQYFGFTPKFFVNGVYNMIVEYLKNCLDELENFINQEFNNCISTSQSKEGLNNILLYLVKKLDSRFDALEKYLLKNVFRIPSNVVLPEDQMQMKSSYTKQDEQKIDQEIEALKKQVMTIKYANAVLQQEIADIEDVQKTFDQTLRQLLQLQDITTKAGVPDLKDALNYSIAKTQKLISVIQDLEDI